MTNYNNKDQRLTTPSKHTENNAIINLATTNNKGNKQQQQGITSTIKKDNTASIKCFGSCNFIFDYEDETYNYYKLQTIQTNDIQSKLKLIDEIEKIRTANNVNWMDLLRLAFTKAPEETKLLIR